MDQVEDYTFRRVSMLDLPLLLEWQSRPHVREWWDDFEPSDQEDLEDPRVVRWIVELDDRPFGYMQDYTVHGWQGHHFAHLPDGARGIDQFIGEPEMIGLGHGSGFIAARMQSLFDAGVPVIATDPHPDNARAIAVYKKVGFGISGPPQATKWGMILPMQAGRSF